MYLLSKLVIIDTNCLGNGKGKYHEETCMYVLKRVHKHTHSIDPIFRDMRSGHYKSLYSLQYVVNRQYSWYWILKVLFIPHSSTAVPESHHFGSKQSWMLLEERQIRSHHLSKMGPQVCNSEIVGIQSQFEQSQCLHKSRM